MPPKSKRRSTKLDLAVSGDELDHILLQNELEQDHLFFSRYFFKARQNIKFIVNWHHQLIADSVQKVMDGEIKNLIINVPPGSSKTEMVVINFIARGLAINPWCRFLHLSYSDDLALLNSQTARDMITGDEYQALWPLKISDDTKSKKRWNVDIDGKNAGGVYATSLAGQITGFRAGHMTTGFMGCILIDDPLKPEDAFSKSKIAAANRKLLTTVKSRKANPDTPIVLIMQRIAENDPTGFILSGNLPGEWTHISIPAVMTNDNVQKLDPKYQSLIERDGTDRFSYWPYKERIEELLIMEKGDGQDKDGAKIGRQVFASQYQQNPIAIGGNIIKSSDFVMYKEPAKIRWRKIFADTAQKTKERNDYSVFQEWGYAEDGKAYLLDLIRGKWEAPDLQKRAVAFWAKAKSRDLTKFGQLRKLMVEDKSSGTGLIQSLKLYPHNIPIEGIERERDKLTRVSDALPYIESRQVCIPEDAPFTNDFVLECEAFTADDSHAHDDQIDPMADAIEDLLSNANKLKAWENAGR